MVTLKSLQAQKKRILARRDDAAEKQRVEFEKIGLQKEIKKLQRSPVTSRNIALAKRTGKGLRILGKKFGAAAIRQAKRIKDQQMRDEATFKKAGKKVSQRGQVIITRTVTGKGKKKKTKVTKRFKKLKTGQNLSKIKEGNGFDVFSNLDF